MFINRLRWTGRCSFASTSSLKNLKLKLQQVKLFINLFKIKVMNALKNRVQLIGHLGNDPEIKTFDSNKTMAKFSIATNETYKNNNGEKITETQWHNVIAWNGTAKTAPASSAYVWRTSRRTTSADMIRTAGRSTPRSWRSVTAR